MRTTDTSQTDGMKRVDGLQVRCDWHRVSATPRSAKRVLVATKRFEEHKELDRIEAYRERGCPGMLTVRACGNSAVRGAEVSKRER